MAKVQKKKGFSLQGFDVQAYRQSEAYVQAVDALYSEAVKDFAKVASGLKFNPNKPFSFNDYPAAKRKADEIINGLSSNMKSVVVEGTKKQWLFACQKNDEFLNYILNTSKIAKKTLAKYQDKNLDALSTFQTRKVNGLDLSQRIWNYTGQMKTQMELGIDIALGDGRSANALSRDLRQYLVDPDKLYRRVRDKHGNLVLSKNAKAFHPGQGKYRSSYKNAMRLTRSEINMAYRESDQLRWDKLDFIVGYEVKLSNNHTLNGKPFVDICDDLKGKYPKTFRFKGWHPQCRCHANPILSDPDEFNTDELNELKAAINGDEYKKFTSRNEVTDVPQGFKDWVNDNAERIKGWKSVPYFIKDNFVGGTVSSKIKSLEVANPKPITQESQAKPKSIVQDRVPSELRSGSNYLKDQNFTFDNEFFSLLDPNKDVQLRFSNSDDSYHRAGLVQIGTKTRAVRSSFYKERIIYHEFGHAVDYQRRLRYSQEVSDLMAKHKKELSKKVSYTRNVRVYDYASGSYKTVKKTDTVNGLYMVSDRLDSIYKRVQRMPDDVFKRRGITKHDVLESIGATQDTIMSLNVNYGWGHSKSYFKSADMRAAEFLAHAFENAYAGNGVFKKYLPALYDDMVAYIKALK